MHHLIMRQIFQVTLDSEKDAYFLQHKISNYLREILAVLQRVLDEVCMDDRTMVIDKLEIDLGEINMLSIRDDSWMLSLEEALREGLSKLVAEKGMEQDTAAAILWRPGRAGVFGQWLFSMKRGYLPWNAGKVDDDWYLQVLEAVATDDVIATELRKALVSEPIVVERVVQQHAATFLVPLTEALTAKKQEHLSRVAEEMLIVVRAFETTNTLLTRRDVERAVWKKVLMLAAAPAGSTSASVSLSVDVILKLLVSVFFTPEQRAWVATRKAALLSDLPVLGPVFMAMDLPVAEQVRPLSYWVPVKGEVSGDGWVRSVELLRDVVVKEGDVQQEKNKTQEGTPGVVKDIGGILDGVKDEQELVRPTSMKENVVPQAPVDTAGVVKNEENKIEGEVSGMVISGTKAEEGRPAQVMTEGRDPAQRDAPVPKKKKTTVDLIGGEEIFVHHAGVILLHPFLNSFFKILGFVADGKFISTALHTRALYLIHFLATGATDPREHDLLIAKILCAYPLDEPVDVMIQLTDEEMEEAGNLLSAAISSWSILKGTSAAGLREGFLQRSGKLQVKGNDLLLLVETGSIDMLLDHLPWNLGIIRLPWMENILRTEWR